MKTFKTVVTTTVVVIVLALAAGFAYIMAGAYDVAADSPDHPVVDWVVKNTRENSVESRAAQVQVPADLGGSAQVQEGAKRYADNCAGCHLAPGMAPTGPHRGMNPEPPDFSEMKHSPDPKEAFWIIDHGVKMTGMPAWGETFSARQIWPLVAFLQRLPKLTPDQYHALVKGNAPDGGAAPAGAGAAPATGGGH